MERGREGGGGKEGVGNEEEKKEEKNIMFIKIQYDNAELAM